MWGAAIVWVLSTGSDNQVMVMMCVALSALTLSIANIAYWPVYAAFMEQQQVKGVVIGLPLNQIGRAHVELQSLMRISYAVFCLKKKNKHTQTNNTLIYIQYTVQNP